MLRALALLAAGVGAPASLGGSTSASRRVRYPSLCRSRCSAAALPLTPRVRTQAFRAKYGPSSGCGTAPPYDPSEPAQSAYFEDEFDGHERGYL